MIFKRQVSKKDVNWTRWAPEMHSLQRLIMVIDSTKRGLGVPWYCAGFKDEVFHRMTGYRAGRSITGLAYGGETHLCEAVKRPGRQLLGYR